MRAHGHLRDPLRCSRFGAHVKATALFILLATGCFGDDDKPDTGDTAPPAQGDSDPETCELPWYTDADGDGFGVTDDYVLDCAQPAGTSGVDGDCDDHDPAIHPAATEACNGADDDCDGDIDEGTTSTFYEDQDGDGFGAQDSTTELCELTDGWVDDDTDCDDTDASIHPDATEICNELDDDCDGDVDEDAETSWYADTDYDGYGDPHSSVTACEQPDGYVADDTDCDDTSAGVYPGATDQCNAIDDDCDGDVDEDVKAGWMLVSIDTNDGYVYEVDLGTAALTVIAEVDDSSIKINTMDVREDGTPIVNNSQDDRLATIDVCSGTTTDIGATGVSNMGGIGFAGYGVLYGLDGDGDNLVELDTTTGAATTIGPLGLDLGSNGLAYDCSTDTLWGADSTTDQIFQIDPVTGAATGFVATGVPFRTVGLEFDHATGLLLASSRYELYTVDPSTGTTTYIGDLDADNIDDLAFHPVCP